MSPRPTPTRDWRRRFVGAVYATHNQSPAIRRALGRCLSRLDNGDRGLNVGAGPTDIHPAVLNLDITPLATVDCCAPAEHLPFADNSFALVVSQETLEHVREPHTAMREICRVLKQGGMLYCQLPFVIGYHPGPTDFWRFSVEGIRALVEQNGLICSEVGIAVGPATGFYRIAVEFVAVLLSRATPGLYHPIKGLAALMFYPLKALDPLLVGSAQADRIAGGYYVIAYKAG